MDGSIITPGGGWGWTNHRDLTGDRFQVTVSLFTHEQASKVISDATMIIRCHFAGLFMGKEGSLSLIHI